MSLSKKSFIAASLGTLIEYYDYALFIIFLPIIAPLFFPSHSAYQSLVQGYFLLLATAIARPLGGLCFGYFGDTFGRPNALLASMIGIAVATFSIGILPSTASIGYWAIVILMITKIIQVFCFGGEYNGAGIYVVEHAQNKQEGLMGSVLSATTLCGALLASLVGIMLTTKFMPTWSWRIAFILGGLLAALSIFYRKNFLETPTFQKADPKVNTLKNMLKQFPRELLAGVFIGGFITVPFTTVLTFISPVLLTKGYFTKHQFMEIQTLISLTAIMTLIIAGFFADKKSPERIMKWGCIGLIIFSWPLLWIIDHGNLLCILIALACFIVFNEMCLGPSNAYLKNLFPMQYRYRASSLSFGFGMSLFGGLTPVLENYLYQYTGHFLGISIWLIFIGIGTWISIARVQPMEAVEAEPLS